MPWWESSGAFALYGVVAGGAITGGVTALSNRHASDLAAGDRASKSAESALTRKHELTLDAQRAARATRERVYPQIAAAAQEAASTLTDIAGRLSHGDFENIPGWTLDTPERRVVWSEMAVFASEKATEAWNEFMRAGAMAIATVFSVRTLAAMDIESEEDMRALNDQVTAFAAMTAEFISATMKMLKTLRSDLSPDQPVT